MLDLLGLLPVLTFIVLVVWLLYKSKVFSAAKLWPAEKKNA